MENIEKNADKKKAHPEFIGTREFLGEFIVNAFLYHSY
jgi:hypothetical protein